MDIEVDLEQLVGTQQTALGPVEVKHQTMMIFVNNEYRRERGESRMHVGYVDIADGAPINWLPAARSLPDDIRDLVAAKVAEEMGGDKERQQFGPPPVPPADIYDEAE